jgi:hypothetical protein
LEDARTFLEALDIILRNLTREVLDRWDLRTIAARDLGQEQPRNAQQVRTLKLFRKTAATDPLHTVLGWYSNITI